MILFFLKVYELIIINYLKRIFNLSKLNLESFTIQSKYTIAII
jgi:hypothetical protein